MLSLYIGFHSQTPFWQSIKILSEQIRNAEDRIAVCTHVTSTEAGEKGFRLLPIYLECSHICFLCHSCRKIKFYCKIRNLSGGVPDFHIELLF